MKKGFVFFSLIILFIFVLALAIFCISPDLIADNSKVIICAISTIIPLLLIARGSLLLQKETYINIGKVAIVFGILYIPIIAIKTFELFEINQTVINICSLFSIYLLILTYIFEINSCSKSVTMYQAIITIVITILYGILAYYILSESVQMSSFIFGNFERILMGIILLVLLIISIPMVNYLFDKNETLFNDIEVPITTYNPEKPFLPNNNINTPQNISIKPQNVVKEMPKYDIPLIKGPVTVNSNNDTNNSNINPSL